MNQESKKLESHLLLSQAIAAKLQSYCSPGIKDSTSEESALGVLLAERSEWNGKKILQTALYALEDANYHNEALEVSLMINRLKNRQQ